MHVYGTTWRVRVALLVAAVLLVPALLRPAPTGAAVTFTDLTGHWAAPDVRFLADQGIIQGFPDGSFRPDQPTSRAEFLTLLARQVALAPLTQGSIPLAVTPADHWALPVVRALAAAGVVRAGDGDPLDLGAPVARGEMARWLVRARGWDAAGQPVDTYLSDVPGHPEAAALSAAVARGIFNGYPDRTFRPTAGATRAEVAAAMARLRDGSRRPTAWRQQFAVSVGGSEVQLRVVSLNLQRPGLTPRVVLGSDRIGGTEPLAAMATRSGAIAAINGTYFQAYDAALPQEPYGTVVAGGQAVHLGGDRAAIGFFAGNQVRIDTIGPMLRGTGATGTWDTNWYAFGLNHHGRAGYGENWSVVYTPAHGAEAGMPADGVSVTVRQGLVTDIRTGPVPVPGDGFVVNLGGSEQAQLKAFALGRPAGFTVNPGARWQGVQELLQAGPRLLTDGLPALNLSAEGFTEPKITTLPWSRSAVATTDDGRLLLVTSPLATVQNLALALQRLGARDAMCLDSGASSGLWFAGSLVTEPGRDLANALVFVAP